MVNLFFQNSIGLSLVVLLLLAFRPLMGRRFQPRARYGAWLIAVAVSLLPLGGVLSPLWKVGLPERRAPIATEIPREISGERLLAVQSPASQHPLPAGGGTPIPSPQPAPILAATMDSGEKEQPRIQRLSLYALVTSIWFAGMIISTAIQGIRHARFCRRIRRWSGPPSEAQQRILSEQATRLGLRRIPPLVCCACVTSPMIVGLLRPSMLIPETAFSEEEWRLIARHELTHVKRRDLWGKSLLLLCLIVHWFNPLAYVMARVMASDCEMSCDASVLANADLLTRKYYGETILGVIRRQRRQQAALSTCFLEGKRNMKRRFESMLDLTAKSRGGSILISVLILSLLAGNVLAIGTPAPVSAPESKGGPTNASPALGTVPADWETHKTPALFGIRNAQHPQYAVASFTPEIPAYNRLLTRAETLRLYDLYYHYDHDGRRADTTVRVSPEGYAGDVFAISAPVAEFAALIPPEKRDESPFGSLDLWEAAGAAGRMPFLLFPYSEMDDRELLQLIEVVDAFNLLVPYVDPWLSENENECNNREMSRLERLRYVELTDLCERDANYRPQAALTDTPGDGLYIKGFNGGGETLYHYPENREMTDEELLQMAYAIVQQRQRSQAQFDYAANVLQEMTDHGLTEGPAGLAGQAMDVLLSIMGDANVTLNGEPAYDTNTGTWAVSFDENTPAGAPRYSYSFKVDPLTGDVLYASQFYYGFTYLQSYLLGTGVYGVLPYTETLDAFDPHWANVAREYLAQGLFYSGAEIAMIRSDDTMNGFCVKVDYADGQKAFLFIDPETDALICYQAITDAEILQYWGEEYRW